MDAKVIDASALAAVLFAEPEADKVVTMLGKNRLLAPTMLPHELTSVCLTKRKRYPEQAAILLTALRQMNRLGIRTIEVPAFSVVTLAERTSLSAYDAAYLWLALRLGVELVTLDDRLAKAWRENRSDPRRSR